VAAIEYPDIFNTTNRAFIRSSFTTFRPNATLFGEYRVADSVGINTTLRYTANTGSNLIVGTDNIQWKRFEAFIGVRWFL
jgi:hypothetical protein